MIAESYNSHKIRDVNRVIWAEFRLTQAQFYRVSYL